MAAAPNQVDAVGPAEKSVEQQPKDITIEPAAAPNNDDGPSKPADEINPDIQAGVRAIEAVTIVWSKSHLIAAYAMIWIIYSIYGMEDVMLRGLNPYVTSDFQLHSLTAATGIMASLISALFQIPLAKILDVWGRPQGLSLLLVIWVIGTIIMATCTSVEMYAAALVLYYIGAMGVSYTLDVFIADTSSLRSRALMLAFSSSPYIFMVWAGAPLTQAVIEGPGWRWGFGIFAMVRVVVISPLIGLLLWNQRKAERLGLLQRRTGKPSWATVKKYAVEVDLLGIFLLAAGMALLLLPFSLWSFQADGWRSPMIICFLVFGVLILAVFVVWEKFWAPSTLVPYDILTDRTVLCGGLMFLFYYFNNGVWRSYFGSQLQVVWNLSIKNASYITSIERVGQCVTRIIVGVLIRWTGRFKWVACSVGIPLLMIGVGLMYRFREQQNEVGLIIMSQVFVAIAAGATTLVGEMAMMAPVGHQHIAIILALSNLFGGVGTGIGGTVSVFIWTDKFYDALVRHLPEGADIAGIYASIRTQLSYPMGSEERIGISNAYSDSQRWLLTAALSVLGAAFICVLLWRDISLKQKTQVVGRVV